VRLKKGERENRTESSKRSHHIRSCSGKRSLKETVGGEKDTGEKSKRRLRHDIAKPMQMDGGTVKEKRKFARNQRG